MKWKNKTDVPLEGHRRRVRKFAFLPTRCKHYTVWLESYESHQEYVRVVDCMDLIPIPGYEWIEFERNHLELYL